MTSKFDNGSARLQNGAKIFEQVTGGSAEDFVEFFNDVAPDFGPYVLEWEFGDLYSRPGLDLRTREIVIIASCATLGSIGFGPLKMHISCALKAGVTRQEIVEILMQLSFSAGLPTAIGALGVAREVFKELDAA